MSPYLLCAAPQATIDFLVAVFEAEVLRTFAHEDGSLMHAEVRLDDTVIMLGGARAGVPQDQPHLHVYVEDVDARYARALAHGATSVQAPLRKDDEDKRGGVQDPNGVTWWIATQGAR